MATTNLFLLIEPRLREYEEDIRQYIESHWKRTEGYRLVQDEILPVVKKV